MNFGDAVGKACLTYILTNVDDAFVLVTFFAEASTSRNLTPWKIILGQYIGFTVIMAISMIGFAIAIAVPAEPIGFLGLLPILLGVWEFLELVIPEDEEDNDSEVETDRITSARSVLKVATITTMNGGDDIGVYIPLFSQTKGAEIAVYVAVYYVMLGTLCLLAYLVMKQKHILHVCEKYASYVVPFLYIGIGVYIVIDSHCFSWSIQKINHHSQNNPGQIIMGVVTAVTMTATIGVLIWVRMRKQGVFWTSEGAIRLGQDDPFDAEDERVITSAAGSNDDRTLTHSISGDESAQEGTPATDFASKAEERQSAGPNEV